MEKQINISDEMASELDKVVVKFGFDTDSDFIVEAIREKLIDLKKLMFLNISEKVANGLRERGITSEDILKDFEKHR